MAADKPLRPFQNETGARQVGELKIENRTDRIEIYGQLTITKDKVGLAAALSMKQLLDSVVDALKEQKLPDHVAEAQTKTVPNPFLKG